MNQLLCAVAVAALALGPIPASAASSPSPALGGLLVAPPSGYAPLTTATLHGQFDATTYASHYQANLLAEITLRHFLGAIIGAVLVLVLIGAAVRLVMVRRREA